jgi:hypothetical protein
MELNLFISSRHVTQKNKPEYQTKTQEQLSKTRGMGGKCPSPIFALLKNSFVAC